ncbi:hypothetical protein PINS_up009633 [Pythium insidiosum]|nr:hypothetical protein PINS_up009633 [Pythium insidiosum]
MTRIRFVRGQVLHAPVRGRIDIYTDAFLAIDGATGRITTFHPETQPEDVERLRHAMQVDASAVLELSPTQFLMPGFIDTHVHAPQYQFTGTGTDTPLMEWLNKYTFPVEASFADVNVATAWYTKLLDRMLSEGITTAQYFATIHVEATQRLVELVEERGQRAFVGLISMDRNAPQSYVSPTTQQCLADAEAFVKWTLSRNNELVQPVVTPRFVPTCTPELLQGLGELAARFNVRIQSHIAESHDEETFVEMLHPGQRDTEIFKAANLLSSRSCMAHAVHLKDDELDVFSTTNTSIAHCPLSNFFFANGLLDIHRCWGKNVHVGLGTDIAGGYSPSMLRAIQTAVLTSKALEIATPRGDFMAIDFKDAFWVATMGGAFALGIDRDTGSFEVGKCLDGIIVDTSRGHTIDVADRDTPMDVFQKIIHNGDNRNFVRVIVKGKTVHQADS